MGVDVVLVNRHLRAVMEHAFNHGCHLRGRTALDLRVNAGRLLVDVPIDHDARPAIAYVPFGQQILVPGGELLGIRSARRRCLSPDVRQAGLQDRIDNGTDGRTQVLLGDVAATNVAQRIAGRFVSHPVVPRVRA